ncbi:hypothetical protein J5Y09_24125, partial [Roseomonas sp. PWR1]
GRRWRRRAWRQPWRRGRGACGPSRRRGAVMGAHRVRPAIIAAALMGADMHHRLALALRQFARPRAGIARGVGGAHLLAQPVAGSAGPAIFGLAYQAAKVVIAWGGLCHGDLLRAISV